MKPIKIINKLNESEEKLTFNMCPIPTPDGYKPSECWHGERGVEVYKFIYKKDKDIYLKYYSDDNFSIGSAKKFGLCSNFAQNSKSKAVKNSFDELWNLWDKYMFKLKKYERYDPWSDEVVEMSDNLSNKINEFIDKYNVEVKNETN